MKSRSLCAQRKMAQRLPLEHSHGIHTPASRISGEDWMFLNSEGCMAVDADRDVTMLALGPGDAPSFG